MGKEKESQDNEGQIENFEADTRLSEFACHLFLLVEVNKDYPVRCSSRHGRIHIALSGRKNEELFGEMSHSPGSAVESLFLKPIPPNEIHRRVGY